MNAPLLVAEVADHHPREATLPRLFGLAGRFRGAPPGVMGKGHGESWDMLFPSISGEREKKVENLMFLYDFYFEDVNC